MTSLIGTQLQGGIFTIELRRPEKKNALSLEMYQGLTDALAEAARRPEALAILIKGQPDVFSAGNDLQDFLNIDLESNLADSPILAFMRAMTGAEKPIVAAVNGLAIGIGTTLLMHCDLVYAGASTRFQLPFVPLGLCPEFGSTLLLPRMAGYQRAAELLLLGEPFDVETAREIGFITEICPDTEVLARATARAQRLTELPQGAVRLAKRAMRSHGETALWDTIVAEMKLVAECLATPDAKEALAAFMERRKPDFSRR